MARIGIYQFRLRCSADSQERRIMLGQSKLRPSIARTLVRAAIALILSQGASLGLAQRAPVSPDHAWHGPGEAGIASDAKNFAETKFNFDPEKAYSLPELIDLAESHNPE